MDFSKYLLHAINDSGKSNRVVHGQIGQYLTVKRITRLAQPVHQTAVGGTVLTGGGVDTRDPEAAEYALLVTTVTVSVT